MSFLARFWPYIAIALALAALLALHEYDRARYAALEAESARYHAEVADANEKAQKAAREALEAQIAERTRIDKHNAEVMADHEKVTAAIAADRDHARELVRRLLAAGQSRGVTASSDVPEAGHQPGASGASQDPGNGLADRVARVASECRGNASQLNALLQELTPQL